MSSAEELYRVALEEMAATGNEKAKLILTMVPRISFSDMRTMKERVSADLQDANRQLQSALRSNEKSWNGDTDASIRDAQRRLMSALDHMTK